MNFKSIPYVPVEGKTYSLFGDKMSTTAYYTTIRKLADRAVEIENDVATLLGSLHSISKSRRHLNKLRKAEVSGNKFSALLQLITPELETYTRRTEDHLQGISILQKIHDKRLGTSREQYHLYMLEIELTNRLYREQFLGCDRKIALLPYCLQDFTVECKSVPIGDDYRCKHCSRRCYQNFVHSILEKNNIEPFIWMGSGIRRMAKATLKEGKSFGILGMACIPELAWGMRKCRKYGIPVVGLPLNANRCQRWFGEFYANSVDLEELERLVSISE